MKYLLGIDVGTSGTKTVLFDTDAKVVAAQTAEYPLYTPHNGWAEQDPRDWWNACCETISGVISKSGISAGQIAGIGISGQMHGLVMLDAGGEVIRRSILWCDQRTAAQCAEINRLVGAKRHIEIAANPPLPGFTASKILWVRENEPENAARCAHILLPKDYIRYLLTGEFATEVSDASGMGLLDVKKRCWSEEILEKLSIDQSLLARVYESVEVTGRVSKQAAELTGLAQGTIVVGGAGDNAAAAVGMGVVTDGAAFTTIGSSGVVYAHTAEIAIDPKGRVHTFCCAVPGGWHIMGVTQAAGLSLKWFRDTMCQDIVKDAAAKKVDPYFIMDGMAQESPVGANRLLYLPYLNGERTPHLDSDCRGVFFGISASHRKADFIRAVMEGVTFSLKDCLAVFAQMRFKTDYMLVCGGGGTSRMWRQMLADVFGCTVQTTSSKEGPALGAAILAGVGAGIYSSVPAACARLIEKNTATPAIAENTAVYAAFYERYRELYPQLKDAFSNLTK